MKSRKPENFDMAAFNQAQQDAYNARMNIQMGITGAEATKKKAKKTVDEVENITKKSRPKITTEAVLDTSKAEKKGEEWAKQQEATGRRAGKNIKKGIEESKPYDGIYQLHRKEAEDAGRKAGKELRKGVQDELKNEKLIPTEDLFEIRNAVNQIKHTVGKMFSDAFSDPMVTESLDNLKKNISKRVSEGIIGGTKQGRGQISQTLKALQSSIVKPINEMINLDGVRDTLNGFVKGDLKEFAELAAHLGDGIVNAVNSIKGLDKRDKRLLGIAKQDNLILSNTASTTVARQQGITARHQRELIDQQIKTEQARQKKLLAEAAYADYTIQRDEKNEAKEEERKRKAEEEARRKRAERLALFESNTQSGVQMANEALLNTTDLKERKRMDDYYRSVQKIAGIYQSAVVHGRVENPQTIYAGISELQRRSAAITNANLTKQFGIDELNEKLKTTQQRTARIFAAFNRVASVVENINNAFATIRNVTNQITRTVTSLTRNILSRLTNQIRQITQSAVSAYQSLQTSMIGFSHFFGEEQTAQLTQQIKDIAAKAPGLDTVGLAEYVRQIAPVSGGDSNLALNASLGMLKTIQYGGAQGSTEMEYVIKNVRDVLAKGTATQIDLRQFNRAMPILEKVLADIGESQLIKDGKLNITKDNVNTILSAFARLNTAKNSPVAGIYDEINRTLGGQWEQFTEQFRTNVMEMFENSGIFGQLTKLLREFNAGEYAQTALVRFGKTLRNLIDNINWFKVQEVAENLWKNVQIIGEGIRDALATIKEAIGGGNDTVVKSFAKWIADIFRGLGDGVAQVIRFVKYVESTGVINGVTRLVGWLGSAGATLVSAFGQFTMNMIKVIGNAGQLYTHIQNLRLNSQLKELQSQMDAIPMYLRSATVTKQDLLKGQGMASPAYSPETSAIENLTQVVNQHFHETEALIQENTAVEKGEQYYDKSAWLPETETGVSRGGKRVIHLVNKKTNASGELSRTHSIGVYNKETKQYDFRHFNSGNAEYDNRFAENYYQSLLARNRLQESSNPLLNKVGNSKIYNNIVDSIDSIKNKLLPYLRNLAQRFFKGGVVMLITETLNAFLTSFNAFGDATVYITGVIKTAGLAIAGAIMGSSVGGIAGGVVGALVGLGVGITSLIQTIKKEQDKLTDTDFNKALTKGQQNILNAATEGLISSGYIAKDILERTDEENYALQQMSNVIANTGMDELADKLEKDPKYLYRVYADALVYKTIGMNSTGQNTGEGFNWNNYKAAKGRGVNTQTDKETMRRMAELISKYDLAADQGWYRDTEGKYRTSNDFTRTDNYVSGEEIWRAYFGDQEITAQGVEQFEKYIADQEKRYSTLKDVDSKTENIKTDITKLTGNTAETFLDNTTDKILKQVEIANGSLRRIAAQNPTGSTNAGLYAENAEEKAKMQSQGDLYTSRFEQGTYDFNIGNSTRRERFFNGLNGGTTINGQKYDWEVDYDYNKILSRVSELRSAADEEDKPFVQEILDELLDKDLSKLSEYDYMAWISDLRKRTAPTFKRYGLQGFASGGSVLSRGIDTVPAMLAPGEFVMKQSAVRKAGLGVMYALNHGDLGMAARRLAGNVSNNWYKNNNAQINNSRNNKTNINNITINNRSNSGRLNSYYALANRLSF